MPETFFDRSTLMTLPGCVIIVQVVCNGFQAAFKFNPKWLALFLSIGLCIYGVFLSQNQQSIDFFLGVLNGFLVFSSAAGITELGNRTFNANQVQVRKGATERGSLKSRNFFSSWFS